MNTNWVDINTSLPEMHEHHNCLFSQDVIGLVGNERNDLYVGRFRKDPKSPNAYFRLPYFEVFLYGEVVYFATDSSQMVVPPNWAHGEFAGVMTYWHPLPPLPNGVKIK